MRIEMKLQHTSNLDEVVGDIVCRNLWLAYDWEIKVVNCLSGEIDDFEIEDKIEQLYLIFQPVGATRSSVPIRFDSLVWAVCDFKPLFSSCGHMRRDAKGTGNEHYSCGGTHSSLHPRWN
mgnify:CR=1 FL=1